MAKMFGEGVIGHAAIVRLLSHATSRPAPSYLLIGMPHLGKRTIAEQFVQALLGLEIDDPHWRSHPDLVLLEAEEGKVQVAVEIVRDARERMSLRPFRADRVVSYIPHADRLNEAGTNALLKVVEEPPAGAVFVFVAEDIGRIPQTLRSRSVVIPFGIVPKDEVMKGLEARGLSHAEAERRATVARGRPGASLADEESVEDVHSFASELLTVRSTGARLATIERVSKACESSEDTPAAWRDVLLAAMHEAGSCSISDPVRSGVLGIGLMAAFRLVGSAVSPRLALEACAIQLESSDPHSLTRLFPGHVPQTVSPLYFLPTNV